MTLQIDTPAVSRSPIRMSEEDYARLYCDAKNTEWVQGEVVIKMPISDIHDMLQAAIRSAMEAIVRRKKLGAVRGENFAMRLKDVPARREPDISFVSNDRLSTLTATLLDGPADLVVEIVSPDSLDRDYVQKFAEYQSSGVREYWLIDPANQAILAYAVSAKTNRYELLPADATGAVRSTVLADFWLRPSLLFKSPPPDALELMVELGIAKV
jgi:Uma2 family endonuclease